MISLRLLSLAALVAGTPSSPAESANWRRTFAVPASITDAQLDAFKLYSQYAGAAYCNSAVPAGNPVACENHVCDGVTATIQASFTDPITGIGGFVSADETRQQIILSLRGTANLRNFITDANFGYVPCDLTPACFLHSGFFSSWENIEPAVSRAIADAVDRYPGFSIVATGHSLGGAVATIGAAYLRHDGYRIDIYTYGSPRVGNLQFVDYVDAQLGGSTNRITHLDDPIPRLPPILLGYCHTSPEYWLSTGNSNTDNYTVADIKVCRGIHNINCNGGTLGLDLNAHAHYFGAISACGGGNGPERMTLDADTNDDQDLVDKVDRWSQQDQEFARQNPE